MFLRALVSSKNETPVSPRFPANKAMSSSLVAAIQSGINAKDVQAFSNALADAKKSHAELAKWIALGDKTMAEISQSKATAVKKVAEKSMAETWTFFFVSGDVFLALPVSEGGSRDTRSFANRVNFLSAGCPWKKCSRSVWRALQWCSATGGLNPLTQTLKM